MTRWNAIMQCLMCTTALVIASEGSMSAGAPEARAPQSKQMSVFSKTSCKNNDCTKGVGRTMTANLQKGLFGKLCDFLLRRWIETPKKLAVSHLPDP